MDDDPEVVLEFELKTSALSRTNYNLRQITITDLFRENYPVIVDLFQIRDGQLRFYACLLVRSPHDLQKALGAKTPSLGLRFTAKHTADDKFYFHTIEFRPHFRTTLKKCGDYELRHLGDEQGSTPESLAQPLWKIDRLATWIAANGQYKRLSDIRTTSSNGTIGNENEDRAKAIFVSHPNVAFLPRTSITSAKEDYIIKLGKIVATVSVRSASVDSHGSMRGSLTVSRKGMKVGQTYGEACDLFCFPNAEGCIMMWKGDEPLRSALLTKKSQLTWQIGALDSFIVKIGDLEKIEQLFRRSQENEESKDADVAAQASEKSAVDESKEDGQTEDHEAEEREQLKKRQRRDASQDDEYKLD